MKLARRAMSKDALLGDECGLTTVEYVIIRVLITVTAIRVSRTFGDMVTKQGGKSETAVEGRDQWC